MISVTIFVIILKNNEHLEKAFPKIILTQSGIVIFLSDKNVNFEITFMLSIIKKSVFREGAF